MENQNKTTHSHEDQEKIWSERIAKSIEEAKNASELHEKFLKSLYNPIILEN